MKSYPDSPEPIGPLGFDEVPLNRQMVAFDLELEASPARTGLHLSLRYNADLFDGQTIARMLDHLTRLLEGVLADPDRRTSALPMMSAAERRQVLVEWNDTAVAVEPTCVHGLVETQVARTPASVAVRCEETAITYRTLNARANQLARLLRSRGVGPGTRAGILPCLRPSTR